MKIQTILAEAGKPVVSSHEVSDRPDRRELTDLINSLGGGTALDDVLADSSKLLYRGLRDTGGHLVIHQDTLASTRSSQNTANYVTWLTEILPSWHRSGFLPRSKIVSCTNRKAKASQYGQVFVVLPTDSAQCVYTGAHDFWDAFEGVNHVYGGGESIPAINDALGKYAPKVISNAAGLEKMCKELEADLDSGKVRIEDLNPELRALLDAHEETHSVLEILDNLMDPSHMKSSHGGHLLKSGDYQNVGEEVQVGGGIVYVEYHTFLDAFFPPRND